MWPVVVLFVAVLFLLFVTFTSKPTPGRRVITAFTMPWCGACKRLAPEWERLRQIGPPQVEAVKVDCSTDDCKSIQMYPTIVCNGVQYSGDRTAEAMKAWAVSL